MNLIAAFIHNPVKVAVGILLLALFGTVALLGMPMQLVPEVQIPTVTIETRWPGASPQEVEREIIQEQEEQLKSVEGVTKMSSESMDSMGRVTMEFLVGADMNEALLKINARLQQVPEYPEDADEPIISTSSSSDRPIAWFILSVLPPSRDQLTKYRESHPEQREAIDEVLATDNAGLALLRLRNLAKQYPEAGALMPPEVDVTKLRKFAEDVIEARFERVPGVSNSNVFGGREEELQVVVDPQRLAARSLTIGDVRRALRGQNKDTSGGDFWEGKRRYVVRTMGQYRSEEQVMHTLLAYRDGAPVYVSDVADVILGHKKPDGLVRRFGSFSIAVNAQRESGANVLEVMDGLREANATLNRSTLAARQLQLTQVYDETEYIYSAVGKVNENIVVGGLLTVAVLLLFLRSMRSTVVIGLAIPTSIIGTFLVLSLLGRSLNVVSLAGLAFAVGMLVDNAVVVLENVYRRYQSGEEPFTAAMRGTHEVWGAVVASTLTTLSVFLPVLFVQEEAGQLFRDIALAVSAGVGLSLAVSVTVIPTAAARILGKRQPGDGDATTPALPRSRIVSSLFFPVDWVGKNFVDGVVGFNRWLQRSVVLRLAAVCGLVGTALLLSYWMLPKVEYLPAGNRNLVFGIILPPPGYNLNQLMELGNQIEDDLRPYWDVDPESEAAQTLDFPVIGDFFYVARGRQVFLGLRAADPLRAGELVELVRRVGSRLPGTIAIANQSSLFEQGLAAGRSIDVEITGTRLEKLIALGGQVLGAVAQFDQDATGSSRWQVIPRPSLDLSSPEVHVTPRWEQAADLGVNASDLGYTVDALVDGAYATDYFIGGDKIDLSIVGQERLASRTQDLEALPVATPSGDLVPMAAVAEVRLASGPEQVNHRERQRAITIQVSPPPQVPLEDAMQRIERDVVTPLREGGQLEGGLYQINLAGTADKLRATWAALWFNLLLALLITYLLMAALFESWLYPFVIILSVPLGAVGGLAGLTLLNLWLGLFGQNQTLDVLTMLGFVILIGTVVNNPILIVHQSLNHMRVDRMPLSEAVLASVRTRIRPIFMTTTTTVLALLPLVVLRGAGSELYRGIGSVVLGGLLVSTVFTLILVPTLFSLTMEAKVGLRRLIWGRSTNSAGPSEAVRPEKPVAVS